MATQQIQIEPEADDASVAPGLLVHLGDLHDFRIGEGEPDIRHWPVVLLRCRRVGRWTT